MIWDALNLEDSALNLHVEDSAMNSEDSVSHLRTVS